jgi:hypothetical protein
MPRIITPDGFVLEFDDEEAMLRVMERLRMGPPPGGHIHTLAAKHIPTGEDLVKAVARTEGQRELLKVLREANGMLARDDLARAVRMDKYKMLGTLGAIYANAAEKNIAATDLVQRERYRMPTGRKAYRYGPGPLLIPSAR